MVLTYRFWTTSLQSDPSVLGKSVRLGDRSATIIGVLEPSVPYPTRDRDHRERGHQPASPVGDDGGWARAPDDRAVRPAGARRRPRAARAELRTVHGAIVKEHPEAYPTTADFRIDAVEPARPDRGAGKDRSARAARGVGAGVRDRVLECREPDPGAFGAARRRAGDPRGARRQCRRAAADAARREPGAVRRRRAPRCGDRAADGCDPRALCVAILGARARPDRRRERAVGRRRPGAGRGGAARVRAAPAVSRRRAAASALSTGSVRITSGTNRRLRVFAVTQIAASFVLLAGAGMLLTTLLALQRRTPASTRATCWR